MPPQPAAMNMQAGAGHAPMQQAGMAMQQQQQQAQAAALAAAAAAAGILHHHPAPKPGISAAGDQRAVGGVGSAPNNVSAAGNQQQHGGDIRVRVTTFCTSHIVPSLLPRHPSSHLQRHQRHQQQYTLQQWAGSSTRHNVHSGVKCHARRCCSIAVDAEQQTAPAPGMSPPFLSSSRSIPCAVGGRHRFDACCTAWQYMHHSLHAP
jgi:hypothetical protein